MRPAGQIDEQSAAELASVGLSPNFPVVMRELHDVMLEVGAGPFAPHNSWDGYRFSLAIDPEHPDLRAERKYTPSYDVVVEAHKKRVLDYYTPERVIAHLATFELRPKFGEVTLRAFTVPELKDFAAHYPVEHPWVVRGTQILDDKVREVSLDDITNDALNNGQLKGLQHIVGGFEENAHSFLRLSLSAINLNSHVDPMLVNHSTKAAGTSEQIEQIVKYYTAALAKGIESPEE